MITTLTCIVCPMGCSVSVALENGIVTEVAGYSCARGKKYAEKEVVDPRRIVTSIVRVVGGEIPILSVKTKESIKKDKIFDCIASLKGIAVSAPVKIGDVIVKNVAGTDVDVIATKSIDAA